MPEHEHNWTQDRVTLWPGPTPVRPITGATVRWICRGRRGCHLVRVSEYHFRRPTTRQQPNVLSREYFPENALKGGT